MKKTTVKIISVMIALICVAGLTVMITSGAESEPVLNIEGFNLSFSDSVYIEYAVSYENASDVKLLVWTNPAAEFVKGTETAVLSPTYSDTVNGKECKVFDYKDLAAKQMTDNVYARAYVEKGGVEFYSDVTKYSVLQYVYNKLGKTGTATTNENLKALLTDMLEYGASAQKYFGYKTDRLATADFVQVKVVGGVLDDGSSCGLYLAGEQVKLTAPSVNAESVEFDHWENSAGANVGTTTELTVTVGDKNEVYTAVYEAKTETTYTVTFKDWDGTELKKETVKSGESATAPADPTREGYRFTGWDKAFDIVTGDMVVTAKYEQIANPTIVVSNAKASAGGADVEITVSLKNNPGITSMLLNITFDNNVLALESMAYNTSIGGTAIPNASNKSPVKAYWAENFHDYSGDWVFVTLKFKVSDTATAGDYEIAITYDPDNIFNVAEDNVAFDVNNGKITVS